MRTLPFTKMHGAGNDFVVFDGRLPGLPWREPDAMARLAARRTGIGCEGVLLLFPSDTPRTAFRLVFLNPDGREADLCGNGTRCAALYGLRHGFADAPAFRIATGAGTVEAEVLRDAPFDGLVRLRLQPASAPEIRRATLADGRVAECVFVDSGVPHAIVEVADVDAVDVRATGRELRLHDAFAPAGANVDFVQRLGPASLRMRTYERGVEDESGACGTGAVAAAVANAWRHGHAGPVAVLVTSGDTLTVDPRADGPLLTGPACEVFRGEVPSPALPAPTHPRGTEKTG